MAAPKKWKMAVIIWIAIYPTITTLFFLLSPILFKIPYLPLRTLVLTLIVVPLMVFILIPFLQKVFKNWLEK